MNIKKNSMLHLYKKFLFRRITAVVFVLLQLSSVFFLSSSLSVQASSASPDVSDSVTYVDDLDTEKDVLFHGNEIKEFCMKSNFAEATFVVSDGGTEITCFKNLSSDFEWISGNSSAELVNLYYDGDGNVCHFQWKYFGCYEYLSGDRLIFEFKSSDGEFSCHQDWFFSKTDQDGSVMAMTHSINSLNSKNIKLPERFSLMDIQLYSEEGYYLQFLDKRIRDENVTNKDVLNFKCGNDNGFDMSVPLYYFNAKSVHGIAVGMGSFSPELSALMNVGVSSACLVCSADAEYKVIEDEAGRIFSFPSFFMAVYDGNNGVGKSFIRNWSSAELLDKYGSLPLKYENIAGAVDVSSAEDIREAFYNMQFFFSVGDARKTTCGNINEILATGNADDADLLKYILRSAMFCDFDYTKVGLTDGSAVKKYAAEQDEIYRNKLASVILSGNQYPIFPGYATEGWDGIEFYDSVNKKGIVLLFKNSDESGSQSTFAVQGVDSETEYRVSAQDGSINIDRISGAELIKNGLTVSLDGQFSSEIIYIEEAETDFADTKILLFGNELSSLELIAIAAILILIIGVVIVAIIINAQDEYKEKKF